MLPARASRKPLVQLSWLLWLSWICGCTAARAADTNHPVPGHAPGLAGANPLAANFLKTPGAPGTLGARHEGGKFAPSALGALHTTTGKVTANLGGKDTLSSAPVSAFGFLRARAGSLPLPPAATTAALPPILKTTAIFTKPLTSATTFLPPTGLPAFKTPALLKIPTPLTAPALTTSAPTTISTRSTAGSLTVSPSTVTAAVAMRADSPAADVVLDNSLGQTTQPSAVVNPTTGANNYTVNTSQGLTLGSNAFLSFSQFNLMTNEIVTFTGPGSVANILARVTGGPSTIDGAINVSIPGANLYLMNPAGIMFTANATISLTGSFYVTTADYLRLGGAHGPQFNAVSGPADASLTSAAVSAFGFLQAKPKPICFAGIPFSTPPFATVPGMNFMVVGGKQTVDGFQLFAPAGQLSMVSVAGTGEVPADPAVLRASPLSALPPLGTITLQDSASVSVQTNSAAGKLEIDAANLNILSSAVVDASALGATGTPAPSANILIRAQNLFADLGTIQAQNFGPGPGATIDIQSRNITLQDGSEISTITFGQGTSGNVTVATGTFNIDGSFVETSTNGSGAAGNVTVTANTLSIAGVSSFQVSGILAESGAAGSLGQIFTGRSGDIQVTTGQLSLTSGGEISATTFGPGQGGNIVISASSTSISGYSLDTDLAPTIFLFQSGIFAGSELPGAEGAGGRSGNITLSTGSLNISSNGLIAASTVGLGSAGNVTITAGSTLLDGAGATLPTGVAATTSYQTGGNGGDITLQAGSLQVLNGAQISAATSGNGAGGNVTVTGGNLVVSGLGSAITAQTTAAEGGPGGSLQLNVNSISVQNGGQISASTQGSGRGGSITITANQVTVDGNSSIVAETSGTNTTITNTPNIASVSITLTINSADDSRLSATLMDPGGDQITLFNAGDATGSNLSGTTFIDSGLTPLTGGSATYTGTFQPVNPLSIFDTGTANGTWTLNLSNFGAPGAPRIPATLTAVTLTVNGQSIVESNLNDTFNGHLPPLSLVIALPVTKTQVKAGAGGSIQINAGSVNLANGGTITASTHGDGAAGSVTVQANSINIDGSHAGSDTGLFASADAGSTGRGGSISVLTKELQITGNGSGIVARSQTNAPAGDITVQTDDLFLNSGAVISSANLAAGPAGSVTINASNSITLQGGSLITVVAQGSNAGMITLSTGQNVELFNGSTITASAGLGGGSIMIKAGNEFELNDSSVVATAGAGAGGNITIDPQFIILDNSQISANAAAGAGGNILIEGQYFFDNESPITATGTTAGTVQITTLPLDIVNALADLQGGFIDLSTDLQESCTMRLGVDASSFLVIGRGDVEDSPSDPQEELRARLRKKARDKAHAR